MPAGLKVSVIRANISGALKAMLQSLLSGLCIRHERILPYRPQNSGLVEWIPGLGCARTVTLLYGVTEGVSEHLWMEEIRL